MTTDKRVLHDCGGESDQYTRDVCEDMYADKCDDVIGLCEALRAIATLCAGHDEHSKQICAIVDNALSEYERAP